MMEVKRHPTFFWWSDYEFSVDEWNGRGAADLESAVPNPSSNERAGGS